MFTYGSKLVAEIEFFPKPTWLTARSFLRKSKFRSDSGAIKRRLLSVLDSQRTDHYSNAGNVRRSIRDGNRSRKNGRSSGCQSNFKSFRSSSG